MTKKWITALLPCLLLFGLSVPAIACCEGQPPGECYTCEDGVWVEYGDCWGGCPDYCYQCVDCWCECTEPSIGVEPYDIGCVGCLRGLHVGVHPYCCEHVVWSAPGGDPSSQNGVCGFVTHWDTPGTKTVTVTTSCGSSSKEVTIVAPTNFRLDDHWVEDDNVLCFRYRWDSSSGQLGDLYDCLLGEKVDYPGGNPYCWPSPPWSNCEDNPVTSQGPPTTGHGIDCHDPGEFLKPYQAAGFTASQIFRYRGCDPESWTTLMGPHPIDREVFWSNPFECWFYGCTKHGAFVLWTLPP